MSFAVPKRIIEEGDTVILFFNVIKMQPVEVVKQVVCKNGQKVKINYSDRRFKLIMLIVG